MTEPGLRRSIGLPLLTFYGLGTILGAGIYVLIGEVAAVAGSAAPSSFVVAAVIAGATALTFAELGSRIPRSAGEAAYVREAFGAPMLGVCIGWGVITVGIVSASTMIRGFVGYFEIFVALPEPLVVVSVTLVLAAIAAWGIGESLTIAAAVTLLEVAGLIFVCFVAADSLGRFGTEWPTLLPAANRTGMLGVMSGAFLAFYAYIGFEDMVNVAEEVRDPAHQLPRAIVLALVLSTALYLLVAVIATLAIPNEELAGSAAPLAVIVSSRGLPPEIIAAISLFAVLNGALIQIIMASRILYGLASQGLGWKQFARINSRTQTPLVATGFVTVILMTLAAFLPLGTLARATSFVALTIFCTINAALWNIKRRDGPNPAFDVPIAVPVAGFLLCLTLLIYEGMRYL